jgi:hypothetical protein
MSMCFIKSVVDVPPPRPRVDMGICSECGWDGNIIGLETDTEMGDYGEVLSEWPLCPVCEDGGCIDDFYPSEELKDGQ